MANIFENAKFGDKFRTRDGRTAVYIQEYYSNLWGRNMHELLLENEGFEDYDTDGCAAVNDIELNIDIIGKWEERDKEIIDKACKWLKRELADPMPEELYQQWCDEKLADFRKAMTEQVSLN